MAVGCCGSEGGAIGWIADHRRHHARADDGQDIHSPAGSLAWAHMLWWLTPDVTSFHGLEYDGKWAPDFAHNSVQRVLNRFPFIFPPPHVRHPLRPRWHALAGLARDVK